MSITLKTGDFGSAMLQKIIDLEQASKLRLGPTEKIILAETGTVEQVLSIILCSEISVCVTSQRSRGKAIYRESLVMDSKKRELIHARTKIFGNHLPANVLRDIRMKNIGIGSIISKFELETFRKIIEIGYREKNGFFFRKYNILYKNKIAFEIEEELVFRKYNSVDKLK